MFEIVRFRSSVHEMADSNMALLQFVARHESGQKMVANVAIPMELFERGDYREAAERKAVHMLEELEAQTMRRLRRLERRGLSIRRLRAVYNV